jgi:hypothetical protein
MGFAALNPSYALDRPLFAGDDKAVDGQNA